jgi:hypothetical protein
VLLPVRTVALVAGAQRHRSFTGIMTSGGPVPSVME